MHFLKTIFLSAVTLAVLAFKNAPEYEVIGTFGVGKGDPAILELKINEDKTFTYRDFSNPAKKINVRGEWELDKNIIVLKNYGSEFPFRDKWKIERNGQGITSRKGLAFYRLAKLNGSK